MAISLSASPAGYADPYAELVTGDSSVFAAGIGAWVAGGGAGTPTRDATTKIADLTASLKFVTTATGQYAEVALVAPGTGVFKAGVEYQALVAWCVENTATPGSVSPELTIGDHATPDANGMSYTVSTNFGAPGGSVFQMNLLRWIPSADRSGVTLRVKRIGTETGTITFHVGVAKALRVHPGTIGLGLVWDPTRTPIATTAGSGRDSAVIGSPKNGLNWRSYPFTDEAHSNGIFPGDAIPTIYNPDGADAIAPGFVQSGAQNLTSERRGGTTVSGDRAIVLEAGSDFVGVAINERSLHEVEVYPDYDDYDVILMDGSNNADTRHWMHEEADGTYKASAGRKSRIGLYFQKEFHVTGAQTTGTAKNEPGDYYQLPFPCEIDEVRIHLGTAPTGSTLIIDTNINGTTIFTTQANRPTVAISATDATSGAPDTTKYAKNDRLSFDIDQVGSTIAGSDLTVMVRGRFLW